MSSVTSSAAFAAYCRLTVVPHAIKQNLGIKEEEKQKEMSFQQFLDCLKSHEIIDKRYSRSIPQKQITDSLINSQYNGNPAFEKEKLSFIEKAYNLGLVDEHDTLRPYYDKKA